jgi:hypothetical protein
MNPKMNNIWDEFMDNMSIIASTAYIKAQPSNQPTVQSSEKNSVVNPSETQTSVHVEISDEAKQKELQESNQQALGKLMAKEDIEGADGSDDKPTLDEMIAELQEEIAQLSQEMAQLRVKGDEKSIVDAKSLEIQIASLTAQLMDLLTQKVELDKSQ